LVANPCQPLAWRPMTMRPSLKLRPSNAAEAELHRVLDEYLETGRVGLSTVRDLAASVGGRHERRRGYGVVLRNGRVIVAAAALTRETQPHVDPAAIPCATCGALPVGTFRAGDPESDRRYDCGPHDPARPGGRGA